LALLALLVWLYASVLTRLFLQWVHDPNFSYSICVPIFGLFVIWQDRKKLEAIPSSPSWAGLPLVVLSMLVLVLGILGADIFLPRVSFLILLAGLIILFQGWTFFRAVLFPWAFLILMIPIPALIMNRITFPLQLLATRLSAALLELVGIVVDREGNIIRLASGPLDVAEACSGIRSLLTLVTLATVYGYLTETRTWVRVVLLCLTVPIAVVANSFRVFGTGVLMQFGYRDEAEGVPHALAGSLIFAVALMMLFAAHRVILLIWKSGPAVPRNPAHLQEQRAPEVRVEAGSFRYWVVTVPMLATAIGLQFVSSGDLNHVGFLPSTIGDWTGSNVPISPEELAILGPGEYLQRNYEKASQSQPKINLFIPFFPSQSAGDTIHSPDHCLLGAGWFPISREVIQLTRPDGSSIPVNRYLVSKSGQRLLVLYWFQAHGRVVASEWRAKYYLISDSIGMHRSDGGMVRLMTPMLDGESPGAAQGRMMNFVSQFLPLLDSYIPS
jgi:exosortase D (VPLPA-CTERM-specific)